MSLFDPKNLMTLIINGRKWLLSPVIFEKVKRADTAMFIETGKHIQINFAYRSTETQAALYKSLKAKDPKAQVAPPGKSFHEKGQAIDVTNWKEAEKYLHAEGLVNPMANDKGHFSFGEFKNFTPVKTGVSAVVIILMIAAGYYLYSQQTKGGLKWQGTNYPQLRVED